MDEVLNELFRQYLVNTCFVPGTGHMTDNWNTWIENKIIPN